MQKNSWRCSVGKNTKPLHFVATLGHSTLQKERKGSSIASQPGENSLWRFYLLVVVLSFHCKLHPTADLVRARACRYHRAKVGVWRGSWLCWMVESSNADPIPATHATSIVVREILKNPLRTKKRRVSVELSNHHCKNAIPVPLSSKRSRSKQDMNHTLLRV